MQLKEAALEFRNQGKQNKSRTEEIMYALDYNVPQLYHMLKDLRFIANSETGKVDPKLTLEENKGTDAYYALGIFYYLPVTQVPNIERTDKIEYGPFVPKVMLAAKEAHDIKYNDWKRTPELKYMLGGSLKHLLELNRDVLWTAKSIIKYREALRYNQEGNFHNLKTRGKEAKEFEEIWGIPVKPTAAEGYVSAVPSILLQWWHARGGVRLPNRMILDPFDWDNTPESIDITEIPRKENPQDRGLLECEDLIF